MDNIKDSHEKVLLHILILRARLF